MRTIAHFLLLAMRWALNLALSGLFRWYSTFFSLRLVGLDVDSRRWIAIALALFPLCRSALALIALLSPGPFFRWRFGYRLPTARERELVDQALELFPAGTRKPSQVLILDGPGLSAFTIGSTIVVERALLRSGLTGALAHQVGRLNAASTGSHLAVWWSELQVLIAIADALDPPPETHDDWVEVGFFRRALAGVLRLWAGRSRVTEFICRYAYPPVVKRDVYAADRWAAKNGAGQELTDFLESHRLPLDFATPYPWLSAQPAVEKRIGLLLRASAES